MDGGLKTQHGTRANSTRGGEGEENKDGLSYVGDVGVYKQGGEQGVGQLRVVERDMAIA